MSKKTRKRLPVQEKAAILHLHLLEHTPVSDLCDRYGIHPTMFYRWQKELFENAAAALEPRARRAGDDNNLSLHDALPISSVEMGQAVCSNKLQPRAEGLPCPRRLGNDSPSRRRPPSFTSISSNTPPSPTSVIGTASTPPCSIAGRRNSSRTPPPRSSPGPDVPAMTTIFPYTTLFRSLQLKWDKPSARISYNLERRPSHVQDDSETTPRPGEGRHPSPPSPRTHPRLRPL